MKKPIGHYRWEKYGTTVLRLHPEKRCSVNRILMAGRRWVEALGCSKAWSEGMIAAPDMAKVDAEGEGYEEIFCQYPAGRFVGYANQHNPGVQGWPVVACLRGKEGMWAIPPDAIPDMKHPGTVYSAFLALRKTLTVDELAATISAMTLGDEIAVAEALADAAELSAAKAARDRHTPVEFEASNFYAMLEGDPESMRSIYASSYEEAARTFFNVLLEAKGSSFFGPTGIQRVVISQNGVDQAFAIRYEYVCNSSVERVDG